ncbi:MAG: ABC transporter ATP-binding protein [Bdellovibrionales bacterium]|nr:ABC transporter ATP-binding protein [Bdellovibrionales bacterium]
MIASKSMGTGHNEAAVAVERLSKVFQDGDVRVQALKEITLAIAPASFASICGPSGSGKTTLLNLIGGLDQPTTGSIRIGGRAIEGLGQRELAEMRLRHVGFIFQAYNLIPVLSALENVAFVMELQGVGLRERVERAQAMLRDVGLEGMAKRRPGELSGGQQQRVAVARAIVSEPDIVLADEPTANLDSRTAESLLELMQRMNEERQVTFIFSTHDDLVMRYARRLIRLHDGEVETDEEKGS